MPASRTPPDRGPNAFLQQIYNLLERNLGDPSVNVNWLADQLAINRKTLYRKVERFSQLTPTDLICQFRLRKAVELLRIGYTVTQTAIFIGFKSSSHFTTVFKEFYQQTPTKFITSQPKRV
ncbi:hypothetical protein GCM10027423_47950 [Spirosoma arcticum]